MYFVRNKISKMKTISLTYTQFFVFLNVIHVMGQISVVLDKKTDLFLAWKKKGFTNYYENGYNLEDSRPRSDLPRNFDFKPFRTTKGIWLLVPSKFSQVSASLSPPVTKNSTFSYAYNYNITGIQTVNTIASFTFTSAAQLMDSVTVRYCLYGNARILIKRSGDVLLYTIAPSETIDYNWVAMNVPLSGSNQFIVEAHVQNPEDFVLVDRIDGFYSFTSSTTTPRPKPTHRTTHPPKSTGNSLISSNYLTIIHLFSFLVMLLRWRSI